MLAFGWDDPLHSPLNAVEMWFSIFLIGILLLKETYYPCIETSNTKVFFGWLAVLLTVIYFFGVFTSNQFIYFQF
jgi:hypothetical protein